MLIAQLKEKKHTVQMLTQMLKQMEHAAFAPTTSPEWSGPASVEEAMAYYSGSVGLVSLGGRKRVRSAEYDATAFGPTANLGLGSFNNTLHRNDGNYGVKFKHEEDEGVLALSESPAGMCGCLNLRRHLICYAIPRQSIGSSERGWCTRHSPWGYS